MDFLLHNAFQEKINVTIYFPIDSKNRYLLNSNFIVYCHSFNGSRTEGLQLLETCIKHNYALVLFDFRANGYSSGKYVSLGWYEALDINRVLQFLIKDIKACRICLYGRSMGASAIVFFLSPKWREQMRKRLGKNFKFINPDLVSSVVLDSLYYRLEGAMQNLVRSRNKFVPFWMVGSVLGIID